MEEEKKKLDPDQIQNANIKSKIQDFARHTTIHGVGSLSRANTTFTKLSWAVCVLGAMAFFAVQFTWLIQKYFLYPSKTIIDVSHCVIEMML